MYVPNRQGSDKAVKVHILVFALTIELYYQYQNHIEWLNIKKG